MSRAARGYGAAFVAAVAVLGVAAGWAYTLLRPDAASGAQQAVAPPLEQGDAFVVRDVAWIRPDASAYGRFAESDRSWRAEAMARLAAALRIESSSAGSIWRPSAEQLLDDAVFLASREGRVADAVALLETWLSTHPADVARRRAAAQLLMQLGRTDEALAHWRAAHEARPGDVALHAEYARALLWAGRYALAASEWRTIVARRPADREARLALAQSLAWGGRPDDAEPLLAALFAETPADTGLRTLLRATRGELTADAARVARWVAEDPAWRPYRVTLARAYDREGRHAQARSAWDAVLADSATVALLSEAAGSAAAGSDSVRSAALLGRAVAMVPGDRDLRARYAQALAWSGDRAGAVREYGVLIAERDDAALRLARGQLLVWMGDQRAGYRDLERSAQLSPSYEAYALMADVRQWQGDYAGARALYAQALALRPGDARALAGLAAARAAERLALASSGIPDESGWTLESTYAEDNAGFLLLTAGISRGVRLGRGSVLALDIEQRRLAQRSAREETRWLTGYTAGASFSHQRSMFAFGATAGIARHALVRDEAYGRVSASVQRQRVRLTVTAGRAPAYEQLWAMRTAVDWTRADGPGRDLMMARTFGASASMPIGPVTVEVAGERLRLDDGNERTSVGVVARAPVRRNLQAVYAAGAQGYAQQAGAYWTPERFTSHALGLEYAATPAAGVRLSARVLPGVTRASERFGPVRGTATSPWTAQVGAGGDLSVQRDRWSATLSGGYGAGGRGGGGQAGYRSLNAALVARVEW